MPLVSLSIQQFTPGQSGSVVHLTEKFTALSPAFLGRVICETILIHRCTGLTIGRRYWPPDC